MAKILIVYATSLGNTKKMAQAVADGARSVETDVALKSSDEATIDDVKECDALILGSPIRHRTADARIKKFIEDTLEQLWLTDEVVGKIGGVFSVGGGYGNMGAGCEGGVVKVLFNYTTQRKSTRLRRRTLSEEMEVRRRYFEVIDLL